VIAKHGFLGTRGTCFGKDVIVANSSLRDVSDAIALVFSVTVCLTREDMFELLIDYPSAHRIVRRAAIRMALARGLRRAVRHMRHGCSSSGGLLEVFDRAMASDDDAQQLTDEPHQQWAWKCRSRVSSQGILGFGACLGTCFGTTSEATSAASGAAASPAAASPAATANGACGLLGAARGDGGGGLRDRCQGPCDRPCPAPPNCRPHSFKAAKSLWTRLSRAHAGSASFVIGLKDARQDRL